MQQFLNKTKHLYFGYLYFFIKYFSVKKFTNTLLNLYEYKTKRITLKSVPSVIHIDVANGCILNCPLCPTGNRNKRQTKGIMQFDDFKVIFDQVKDYVFFVWLYNWGEPFLCKDIFKIVNYCHANNVGVKIDSNLNFYDEKLLEKIVDLKVDYISFSIDGLTQDIYQFYRKNGDIKKVLSGLEKLIKIKRTKKTRFPIMVWQYLVNNVNYLETEMAREHSVKIGMDIFEMHPLSLYTEVDSKYSESNYSKYISKIVNKAEARKRRFAGGCRYLWCSLAFNPDGSYIPCPIIYKDSDVFGSFKKGDSIKKIINSEIFSESRKIFVSKNYEPKCFTACKRCDWFAKP